MYLNCLCVKVLREGGIRKEAVYVVLGIDPEGHREVLGFYLFPNESAVVWQRILQDLWKRGMREVLVFVSDGLPGMEEAILRVYPNAEWQQCLLHKMRNTLAKVRREDRGAVAWELKRIYLADSQKEAESAWRRFRARWERKYPRWYGHGRRSWGLFLSSSATRRPCVISPGSSLES